MPLPRGRSYPAVPLARSAPILLVLLVVAAACRTTDSGPPPGTSGQVPPPPPSPPAPAPCVSGPECHRAAETLAEGDPARGEQALVRCLECADAPPSVYTLLASLRSELHQPDSARRALQDGVRRYPDNGLLWMALGRHELSAGRHREGLQALATARRLRPDDQNLADEHDHHLLRYGSDEDRIEAKIQPLLQEAAGRFELEDKSGALRALEAALVEAKGQSRLEAQIRHRMALVHLSSGELALAQSNIEMALAILPIQTPQRAEVLLTDAEVLLSMNRPKDAAAAAQTAIDLDPANPLAYANLGIARSLSGDPEAAITSLEQGFRWGLARRLTPDQFLAIPAIEKLKGHARFPALMRSAWPERPYPYSAP